MAWKGLGFSVLSFDFVSSVYCVAVCWILIRDIMADWRKFQEKMKNKRLKKGKKVEPGTSKAEHETIVVQRLSAEVTGKAQKYSRIGAREFVSFEDYGDLTIENIKEACVKHYNMSSDNILCDVLAGEQGPSCSSLKQIPSLKVIHVRFVDKADVEILDPPPIQASHKKPRIHSVGDLSTTPMSQQTKETSASSPSKFVPRSLSVVDMLKLGKVINKNTTSIEIYDFDMTAMVWSKTPTIAEFIIEPEPFGVGGFRKAFQATSHHTNFKGSKWVVKRYLTKAVKDIEETNQTLEEHTKKVVQMHYLARNFTAKMNQELIENGQMSEFGKTLSYKKIFMGKICCEDDFVTVEEFIEGKFEKYVNNDGNICGKKGEVTEKAECLVHFSYEKSNKEVMLLDVQGCGCTLFDPEICSKEILSEDKILFCTGNLSTTAINNFVANHHCNIYCQLLKLGVLQAFLSN